MSYHLCVDCGGSKTAAAIADVDGNILGRGIGGPSNFAYLGLPSFMQAVTATITSALGSFLPASEDGAAALPPAADKPLFGTRTGVCESYINPWDIRFTPTSTTMAQPNKRARDRRSLETTADAVPADNAAESTHSGGSKRAS